MGNIIRHVKVYKCQCGQFAVYSEDNYNCTVSAGYDTCRLCGTKLKFTGEEYVETFNVKDSPESQYSPDSIYSPLYKRKRG